MCGGDGGGANHRAEVFRAIALLLRAWNSRIPFLFLVKNVTAKAVKSRVFWYEKAGFRGVRCGMI